MIRVCDCDYCINRTGFEKGHTTCKAFANGVPYEHMDKDLKSLKECNNGIGFEQKEDNNEPSE